MTDPRRYTDTLRYKAIVTSVGVLAPILVNVIMLAYTYGRVSEHVDSLEKRQAALEQMLSAHIASAGIMWRAVPQSDQGTEPQTPQPRPKVKPQGWNGGDCHLPRAIPGKTREVKLWHLSRPRS